MASLSADLFYDILKRLDAAALARAGCACADFRAISNEEDLWENACTSLWPSTRQDDVRSLIVSVGGFRKFYADCFTLILNKDVPVVQTNESNFFAEEWAESDYYYYDDMDELETSLPSDFVSLIDVWYKDRALYSKVIWGIPNSDSANGWFYNYPFRIDLFQHSAENNENNNGEVFLSTINDLPSVPSIEQERKDGKLWRELNDGIKLSWIIVNRKMKRAVNLTSWHPLSGQRHWPTDTDFVLRFGSVLPAKEVLPCQIEDMGGVHLNGRCSLLLLKEALSCHRSRNYDEVLESCNLYLKAQSELKEEKIRSECRFDTLCIFSGITIFAAICTMCYRKF
ncbi:probable F-box protein At2g36090 isoform X2 [Sorghum bicolor]|uniref:F-box domain-containing protein n=1 Tax=Sorghum bicolor TaxID=4558 RepID=A0A1B6QN37_SORBI|nr:probable F-box protein At2g36090 isoform X2 [Sorghum bicolor]KXG39336.1 hypothetical protein SORBI_3001G366600 [Sorghum bicolor]|eukprot:XP_021306762.1 probable F-box protein At2g36090 isoform X2 [Sorghum bicolor]